jgi:hypothetical protein
MNVLARVIAIREAFDDGDDLFARQLLRDLEHELAFRPHVCATCGRRFRWPGELQDHIDRKCGVAA